MKVLIRITSGLVLIALTAFAADRMAAHALEKMTLKSEFRFSRLYRGNRPPSTIILGNSRAVNAFFAPGLTHELGTPTINLGFNGMNMETSELVLRDYLDRNQTPERVLIEVSNLFRSEKDSSNFNIMQELKPYIHLSHRLREAIEKESPALALALKVSHLYRFNCEIFFRIFYYMKRSDQDWANSYQITPELIESISKQDNEKFLLLSDQLVALQRIIKELDGRKIPAVLVLAPYFPDYQKKIANLAAIVEQTQMAIGSTHQIHNYSDAFVEKYVFADRVHFNRRGSQELLERMIKDGLFSTTAAQPKVGQTSSPAMRRTEIDS